MDIPPGFVEMVGPAAGWKDACETCVIDRALPAPSGAKAALLLRDDTYQPIPRSPLALYSLAIQREDGWYLARYIGQDGTNCGGDAPFHISWSFSGAAVEGSWLIVGARGSSSERGSWREATVCTLAGRPACGEYGFVGETVVAGGVTLKVP